MKKFNKSYLIIGSFLIAILGILFCSPKLVLSSGVNSNPIKVSIVLPVYNTEKYLNECLESLENQTLKEIEIICVNDGSKDNSLQILQEHAKNDSRIKIIDQENKGVSVARNVGINAAQGDYIAFVDSDDLVVPYAYEKAYGTASKYDIDVIEFGRSYFNDDNTENILNYAYDKSKINFYQRFESENPFDTLNINVNVVWDKLWKRSFILENNLTFKKGVALGEDTLFDRLSAPYLYFLIKDRNVLYCKRCDRLGSAMQTSTIKKELNNYLIIDSELMSHRNQIEFKGSDEWILSTVVNRCYDDIINNLENIEDKKYYSGKFVEIIEKEFLHKYGIKPSAENNEKIHELKLLSTI